MSLWEFHACMDGLRVFHGGKKKDMTGDLSEERLRELGVVGF